MSFPFILVAAVILVSAMASYLNYKIFKFSNSIGITFASLLISTTVIICLKFFPADFIPIKTILSGIDFHSVIIDGMLGYLLFAAALHINTVDFKKQLSPIILLASIGVICSTILIGFFLYWVSHLLNSPISIFYCFLFGALISPTDPIAVVSVFKTTNSIPKKVKSRILGESLFNDATGIILFVILYQIVTNTADNITFKYVLTMSIREVFGAIVLGAILGKFVSFLLRDVDDRKVAVLITLALTTAGYLFAHELGTSAPIMMVISGLIIGHDMRKGHYPKRTSLYLNSFWELWDDILNTALFVLIGLEVFEADFHVKYLIIAFTTFLAIVIIRYVILFISSVHKKRLNFRKYYWKENLLMSWGAIRGGISIALALSIQTFEGVTTIFTITYYVVLFSIFIQGSTFKWLVLKLFPETNK